MQEETMSPSHHGEAGGPYLRLLGMAALSFGAMYGLMYAMVDRIDNVYHSLNQVYMAGLMTAPMVVNELLLMRTMYRDRRRNAVIMVATLLAGVGMWVMIRQQAGISDRQFLRSMIPHHAGAILMCQEAPIGDPEILGLCGDIIAGQQSEIDLMRRKLQSLRQ
jgi:uncharacterized protein (DUF305 family)